MLTVKINDIRLENSITEKARLLGKSTQEFVKDLLLTALPENQEGVFYQKLNPEAFGYILNTDIECELPIDENISLFSDVDNAAEYIQNIRKKVWRK